MKRQIFLLLPLLLMLAVPINSSATNDLLIYGNGQINLQAVPEPSPLIIMGTTLVGFALFFLRRRKKDSANSETRVDNVTKGSKST